MEPVSNSSDAEVFCYACGVDAEDTFPVCGNCYMDAGRNHNKPLWLLHRFGKSVTFYEQWLGPFGIFFFAWELFDRNRVALSVLGVFVCIVLCQLLLSSIIGFALSFLESAK